MSELLKLIKSEEKRLNDTDKIKDSVGILYNLIFIKNSLPNYNETYQDIKKFFDLYFEAIKISGYGYDHLNIGKIEKLINLLNSREMISVLQYAISVSARELPEHDRNWFIEKQHSCEINIALAEKKYSMYPKLLFIYTSQNIKRLFLALFALLLTTNLILLPNPYNELTIFEIQYEKYSENFLGNHFLNIISMFADIKNGFEIKPQNWVGLIYIVIGKTFFALLIVNFIYRKISDKINLK